MINSIKAVINELNNNRECVLVTIVSSRGSLPRKKGAYMIVGQSGRIEGSVGGGNIEYNAINVAKEYFISDGILKSGSNYLIKKYVLNNKESAELGMVCGGDASLLFYPIFKNNLDKYKNIYTDLLNGNKVVIDYFDLVSNEIIYKDEIKESGYVYVFGAGHVAIELVPVLSHLNFKCIVIDDRANFANKDNFPTAYDIKIMDLYNLDNNLKINEEDYVISMTRGHEFDLHVEAFALKNKPHYIGVIGSKRKISYINSKLIEMGFNDEEINSVYTPIGLDIGSETPQEIAISIAAELIKVRSDRRKQYE